MQQPRDWELGHDKGPSTLGMVLVIILQHGVHQLISLSLPLLRRAPHLNGAFVKNSARLQDYRVLKRVDFQTSSSTSAGGRWESAGHRIAPLIKTCQWIDLL